MLMMLFLECFGQATLQPSSSFFITDADSFPVYKAVEMTEKMHSLSEQILKYGKNR